jgi:hypothetical protein
MRVEMSVASILGVAIESPSNASLTVMAMV